MKKYVSQIFFETEYSSVMKDSNDRKNSLMSMCSKLYGLERRRCERDALKSKLKSMKAFEFNRVRKNKPSTRISNEVIKLKDRIDTKET